MCPPVLQRLGVYRPVDLHLPQTYLRPGGVAQDLSADLTGDAHRCAQQFARWLTPAALCCRDIFTVRLTPSEQAAEAAGSPESRAPFVCPVTGLSCLRFPMSALPGCGHAFSSRALAQVSAPASISCIGGDKTQDIKLNRTLHADVFRMRHKTTCSAVVHAQAPQA